MQNFILANKDRIKYYNDLHSAASMVLFPWGYSPQVQNRFQGSHTIEPNLANYKLKVLYHFYTPKSNPDADDQLTVFARAAAALNAVHGYEYVVGSVFDTIYPASVHRSYSVGHSGN